MIKKIIVYSIWIISAYSFAQTTNTSPYSFFGIGDPAKIKSVEEIAMGQTGGTLNSEYQLSFTNPASYGSLLWTTYVFSASSKLNYVDDGSNKQNSATASLNYIAIGIPINGNQGLAFGLQLNTAVGYSLFSRQFDSENILIESDHYTGSGGTNRVFMGYGYKFPFNLNLGVEAAYQFGGIDHSILNRRLGVQLGTRQVSNSDVHGFSYKLGALYSKDIKNDLQLKFGASAQLAYDLTEEGEEYIYSLINTGDGTIIPRDTLLAQSFNSKIKTPLKTVLSAGIGKLNKWQVAIDYTFQDAIDFTGDIHNQPTNYYYTKSSLISIGGFYTPRINSISSYWDRVTYRAGFSYNQVGLNVNNTDIKDYGMSFGVSLPMGLQLSNVNLGFEIGQRGTTKNNLIKENYYNFRLSLSLNDKWFRKQKIY